MDELDTVFFTRCLQFSKEKRQEESTMYGESNSNILAHFKERDCNKESSLTRKWTGVVRDKAEGCVKDIMQDLTYSADFEPN